jgi:hypothetical protein
VSTTAKSTLFGVSARKKAPAKPEQQNDTKALSGDTEIAPRGQTQPSGMNEKQKAELTKIFTAARNAYMELVAFF